MNENISALIKNAQNGDFFAREKAFTDNIALLKAVVRGYTGRGVEWDDLYQIGSIGLLKAIDNFDSEYGVKFSTYAVPMISGEIKRYFRDDGIVKISRSIKENAYKLKKAEEELFITGIDEPELSVIADKAGISLDDAIIAMDSTSTVLSLSAEIYGDDGSLMDIIADEDDTERIVTKIDIESLLSRLENEDREIIIMRYVHELTQSQIAKRLGTSQVQISRRLQKLMQKLKKYAI